MLLCCISDTQKCGAKTIYYFCRKWFHRIGLGPSTELLPGKIYSALIIVLSVM